MPEKIHQRVRVAKSTELEQVHNSGAEQPNSWRMKPHLYPMGTRPVQAGERFCPFARRCSPSRTHICLGSVDPFWRTIGQAYAKLQFRDLALFKVCSRAIQRSLSTAGGRIQGRTWDEPAGKADHGPRTSIIDR